jgi:hypothetical protein
MLVEVGAFYIEDSLPAERRNRIWLELHLQEMRVMFGQNDNPTNDRLAILGTAFHAYADERSRRMYLPDNLWGWEYLTRYTKGGKTIQFEIPAEGRPQAINIDGDEWWPIILHPEKLEKFNRLAVEGKVSRFVDLPVAERRREVGQGELDHAEAVETVGYLAEAWKSKEFRVCWGAQVALYGLLERAALYRERRARAGRDPSLRWSVSPNGDAYAGLAEPLLKAMRDKLRDPDPASRRQAIEFASRILSKDLLLPEMDPAAVLDEFLLASLSDPDSENRARARNGLFLDGYPERLRPLFLRLGTSPREACRRAAHILRDAGFSRSEMNRVSRRLADFYGNPVAENLNKMVRDPDQRRRLNESVTLSIERLPAGKPDIPRSLFIRAFDCRNE